MSLLEQLFQLLSEPPGSVVYHLVTLFAIQATLAIAWWQWRRLRLEGERDDFAWRLLIAGGGLLGLRVLAALVSIYLIGRDDRLSALRVLPPLEQTLETLALILLAWALLPPPRSSPRLNNVLAAALLHLTAILSIVSFRLWWLNAPGAQLYSGSGQALVWGLLQLLITVAALIRLFAVYRATRPLRLALFAVLFGTYFLQLLSLLGVSFFQMEETAWVRLGNLIALPILAVIAYRHTLASLLSTREYTLAAERERFDLLPDVVRMMEARGPAAVASEAACFALMEMSADAAAIALLNTEPDSELTVVSCLPAARRAIKVAGWSLARWQTIRDVVTSHRQVELSADVVSSEELAEISASLGMGEPGSLVVAPLMFGNLTLGVLLLGYRAGAAERGEEWQQRLLLCRRFISRVLINVPLPSGAGSAAGRGDEDTGQPALLKRERDAALLEARSMQLESERSRALAERERRRADELAARLSSSGRNEMSHAHMEELTREITALRETIRRSEEQLATVESADLTLGAGRLLHMIAEYAGQLESAWTRVEALEKMNRSFDLAGQEPMITSLARALRTPLTAIYGYSALLAAPNSDSSSPQQAEFLRRIRADVERMDDTLTRLSQPTAGRRREHPEVLVEASEQIDKAISMVLNRVRGRRLLFHMDIEPLLPPVATGHHDLSLIAMHLLNNACDVSPEGSRVTLNLHVDTLEPVGTQRKALPEEFLHLEVIDSGSGIRPEDLSRLFHPQDNGESRAIGGIGESNAGLAAAHALVTANGGRIWAGRAADLGTVFSVLLPLDPADRHNA